MNKRIVITGAFSYTGAAVTRELLSRGYRVHSLTNRQSHENNRISVAPLRFEHDYLKQELSGAFTFINTYWVRLPYGKENFASAVKNSRILIDAAGAAGVKRIVNISVSNAEAGRNLGYYTGKAQVDEYLRRCGVPFTIVRPTLIVGPADVLTNNIAWMLRRIPVFFLPNGGGYRLQPITLNDTARIIADAVEHATNQEIDAAGPDIMTFVEYVGLVSQACGLRRPIIGVPEALAIWTLKAIQLFLRDIILTREELLGLKQELLMSYRPSLGKESVKQWLLTNGEGLGRQYTNDLDRHFGQGRRKAVLMIDKAGNLRPA